MWNWLQIETFWKLNEREWNDFPKLSPLLLWSPWIQIHFKYKTLERRWHDFFHLINEKGFWKYLNFIWKYFPILKLYATQWFSREKIKWLLQNIWNRSWEFQRIKFKSFWKLFLIWSYLGFIQIIFLQNKNIQKIG